MARRSVSVDLEQETAESIEEEERRTERMEERQEKERRDTVAESEEREMRDVRTIFAGREGIFEDKRNRENTCIKTLDR